MFLRFVGLLKLFNFLTYTVYLILRGKPEKVTSQNRLKNKKL